MVSLMNSSKPLRKKYHEYVQILSGNGDRKEHFPTCLIYRSGIPDKTLKRIYPKKERKKKIIDQYPS